MRRKYRNKKTKVAGIIFDSRKEAYRYAQLRLLQRAGKISKLQRQPKFLLLDSFKDNQGKKHRAIHYIADFAYIDSKGRKVVEDVKGYKTSVYKLKKKLFLSKYQDVIFKEI